MSEIAKRCEADVDAFINEREKLLILAKSMVGSHAIAEELVQDSWLRWDARNYPVENVSPILKRIVSNLCRDWLRRQKTERFGIQFLSLFQDVELDTERIVISREDLMTVVKALDELPKRTVAAFYMNRIDGLTFKEIAISFGVSTPRVHQLVSNALVHVASRLED